MKQENPWSSLCRALVTTVRLTPEQVALHRVQFLELNTVQCRMRREPREGSFSDYFSLGGRQAPTPERTVAADALAYLQECNFTVYPAPLGEGEPKYVYQGQVLTLDRLVAIANDHRALRHLPPFPFLQ